MTSNGNGHNRLWAIVMLLVGALLSLATYLVQSQINGINARLDRITTYVLDHQPK